MMYDLYTKQKKETMLFHFPTFKKEKPEGISHESSTIRLQESNMENAKALVASNVENPRNPWSWWENMGGCHKWIPEDMGELESLWDSKVGESCHKKCYKKWGFPWPWGYPKMDGL